MILKKSRLHRRQAARAVRGWTPERVELRSLILSKSNYQFESTTKKTPQGLIKNLGMKRLELPRG